MNKLALKVTAATLMADTGLKFADFVEYSEAVQALHEWLAEGSEKDTTKVVTNLRPAN